MENPYRALGRLERGREIKEFDFGLCKNFILYVDFLKISTLLREIINLTSDDLSMHSFCRIANIKKLFISRKCARTFNLHRITKMKSKQNGESRGLRS